MTLSKIIGQFLLKYYKSPDHPFKLRIFFLFNRFLDLFNFRITIRYYQNLWISLSLSDYIDKVIFEKGEYEAEVFNSLMPYFVEDEILWDIGSHIGSFALKGLYNKSINAIYCFEPNPKTFQILTKNKSLNVPNSKMNLYNIGLGDQKTNVLFQDAKNGNTGGSKFVTDNNAAYDYKLPIDSIDNLVFNDGLPPPTIIKIDVEGYEQNVFNGAKKTFSLYPPKAIIFESVVTDNIIQKKEIIDFLKKYNYDLILVHCQDEQGGPFTNILSVKK